MNPEIVVDIIAIQDNGKRGFFSLMPHERALEIQSIGFQNTTQIILRETSERTIPEEIKNGTSLISDIWVKIETPTHYCLN